MQAYRYVISIDTLQPFEFKHAYYLVNFAKNWKLSLRFTFPSMLIQAISAVGVGLKSKRCIMIYRLHKLLAPYNNTRGTVNLTCCSILDPWPMKFFSLTVVSNGIFFSNYFITDQKVLRATPSHIWPWPASLLSIR